MIESILIIIGAILCVEWAMRQQRKRNEPVNEEVLEAQWAYNAAKAGGKERGIHSPFSDMGGHTLERIPDVGPDSTFDFDCENCEAVIRWCNDGLYRVVEGPNECPHTEAKEEENINEVTTA